MPFQTTGKRRIVSAKSCVVYDKVKGRILHVHHVLTIEGAQEASDSDVEKKAVELATSRGIKPAKISVLSVDPKLLESHARYKVDVKKRVLVELPRRKTSNSSVS